MSGSSSLPDRPPWSCSAASSSCWSCACRWPSRSALPACRSFYLEPRLVDDDARAGNLQRLQLVHPAGRAVLPADREPDERRRYHRPAGGAVALDGRQLAGLAGADQRRALGVLRRHLRLLHRRRGQPVQDLHRCPDQGGLRPFVLDRHHRGLGRAGRHHPALDPDDRVGWTDLDLDRRAVSGRRGARAC